ncbi:hypothetical protein EDB89DRAFT_2065972 [Lactarius sanguifluus]|nr:hypothetical protein EDB89DRAFT_2065972 [Lactarius sanguifluus]
MAQQQQHQPPWRSHGNKGDGDACTDDNADADDDTDVDDDADVNDTDANNNVKFCAAPKRAQVFTIVLIPLGSK